MSKRMAEHSLPRCSLARRASRLISFMITAPLNRRLWARKNDIISRNVALTGISVSMLSGKMGGGIMIKYTVLRTVTSAMIMCHG